jgi:DNA-binding MarR family transcriptional regulator
MTNTSRQELIRNILENMNAMKRSMFAQLHTGAHQLPIPRGQLELLIAICHLQPVNSKALAQKLYLTPGAVSQQVEGLEQQGYIVRRSDPNDRRIQSLQTTTSGETLVETIMQHRRKVMEQVMQDLSDEELRVWDGIQTRLIERYRVRPDDTEK